MTPGYAYVEVLIAAALLSIAMVPAADALQSASQHGERQRELVEQRLRAQTLFESVLVERFSALDEIAQTTGGVTVSTAHSDSAGTTFRRRVFISPYDADNLDGDNNILSGADSGIVQVSVDVEGTDIQMATLVNAQ